MAKELYCDFLQIPESFFDEFPSQVPHVQQHVAVDAAPLIYFGLLGARNHVP